MMLSAAAIVLSLAALLPAPVAGFWRMPCPGRIVTERIDPIIFPGIVSPHVHQVAGGNGFGFTETYQNARNASCTSCPIKQDLSNYWTPVLYYKAQNGSFIKVPQAGDGNGVYGGMTVYYLQRPGPNNDALKAFPEGFRMVAGNPFQRNFTNTFAAQAVSFVCLNYNAASSADQYTNALPTMACPDGLRAQVFFPSCWDGVNLDSADHSSHMAYPASGAYNSGSCPSTHPVHLISIFFEVIFSTAGFDFWEGDYGTGQPFVFAMGDPTGYGFHGDFVNGWDVDALQQAVNTCTDDSGVMQDCSVFDFYTDSECQDCQIPVEVDEDVNGPFDAMPGCNPVSAGPGLAAPASNCATTSISSPELDFTDVSSTLKWAYVGCGIDSVSARVFTGYTNMYNTDQGTTTVESCLNTCSSKGFAYAGLEYGEQCFCGSSLPSGYETTSFGNCAQKCAGNSTEFCGGSNALSIYKNCAGSSSCINVGYTTNGASSSSSSGSSGGSSSGSSSVAAGASSSTSSSKAASSSSSAPSVAGTSAKANKVKVQTTKASSSSTTLSSVKLATTSVHLSSSVIKSATTHVRSSSKSSSKKASTTTSAKKSGNQHNHAAKHTTTHRHGAW